MNHRIRLTAILLSIAVFAWITSEIADARVDQPNIKAPVPSPTSTPPIIDDDEVIKIDTEVVNVLFTAQDRNRRLLTDLRQEDVQILENGQVQEISSFSRKVDLPLSLAILIDVSVSQQRTLPEEKAAAISFLETVIRASKDEVAVISFTGEATLEQDMTNNLSRLRRAIERVKFIPPSGYIGGGVVTGTPPLSRDNQMIQGSTAIYDAVWVTSDEILGPAPERTRRAIILLSDGDNTSGKKKLDEAVQSALRAEAAIYAIGIGDNFYSGVVKGTLEKLSDRTGGRAYFPKDERDLREAFRQIQEEMRSQYLIAYEPSDQKLDGVYRKIEIRLLNPVLLRDKIKLTHRQGYFAKNRPNK